MSKIKWFIGCIVLVFAFAAPVIAQDSCPALIQSALEAANAACAETARNQACYGNVLIDSTSFPGVENFTFETLGDKVNILQMQQLTLSGMNQETGEWGVALFSIQANLPATLPGQNVTLVLFGDVVIENAVSPDMAELPTVEATATAGVNVRARPDGTVIDSLANGEVITANGRLADSSWIRVQLEDSREGWVSGQFLSAEGGFNTLAEAIPNEPVFGPMQAFYFTSGIGDSQCEEAPSSGIMIQTPQGVGKINLNVNGVDVALGSTIFMQAAPDDFLYIYVVEGSATIEHETVTQFAAAGTVVRIPLNADGVVDGPPEAPQPYDIDLLLALPVEYLLPQLISVAPPLTSRVTIPSSSGSAGASAPGGTSGGDSGGGGGNSGCSISSTETASITFVNNTGGTVSTYWISFNCAEVFYVRLEPGQSYTQQTYVTHPWIVRDDGSGATLTRFTPASAGAYTVSVP